MPTSSKTHSASTSTTIPLCHLHRRPRNVILCFDGTGNEFGDKNTNIVRLFSILRVDRPEEQVCYYQAGVGTYFKDGVVRPRFQGIAKLLDEGFAWYISEHILDGYKFLMQNYYEGDTVCIFGFSRGAYTARALAGMLHKVGLLSKDNFEQIPFAYRIYKAKDDSSRDIADRFKKTFAREVIIDFLGVWYVDTVPSVGLLWSPTLPFAGSNDMIRVFRHALSLDEHRVRFRPNFYHCTPDSDPPPIPTQSLLRRIAHFLNPFKVKYLKRSPDTPHTPSNGRIYNITTDVQEVWFRGCHADVGGGNANDLDNYALSNVSLRWMVREIVKAGITLEPIEALRKPKFKILFDLDHTVLNQWNIPRRELLPSTARELSEATVFEDTLPQQPEGNYEQPLSSPEKKVGSDGAQASSGEIERERAVHASDAETFFDTNDALGKIRDELKQGKLWWFWRFLEIIPTYYEWQDKYGRWLGQTKWNLASGRVLPPNPIFHKSVDTRKDSRTDYPPVATWEEGTERYVQ
ncbi:hypothetical protein BC827DRAFT_1146310 [Russula dissimulans]|nr:hypothetical protein BC827DRAFT_1146310 [Russula dissimulans]